MAAMAREAWTDERLDDLKATVDTGFTETRAEFRALQAEIRAQTRMMVHLFGAMFAAMLVGFLGVIATVITQG